MAVRRRRARRAAPFRRRKAALARRRIPRRRAIRTLNPRSGGFLGIETKFLDANVTSRQITNDTWTGAEQDPTTLDCLNGVAQGDGESNRDGRNYAIRSVHIRGWVDVAATESSLGPFGDALVRIALVLDTQTNATQLSAETVFTGTSAISAFRDLQNIKRFKVLKEKMILLPITQANMNEGAVNLFANGGVKRMFKINHIFNTPLIVNTSGTTNVVGVITDNSLHIIATQESASIQDDQVKLTYNSRVRFVG